MAKLCNNCGKESMDDVLFCTGCGADLQAQAQQAAPQAQQNPEASQPAQQEPPSNDPKNPAPEQEKPPK